MLDAPIAAHEIHNYNLGNLLQRSAPTLALLPFAPHGLSPSVSPPAFSVRHSPRYKPVSPDMTRIALPLTAREYRRETSPPLAPQPSPSTLHPPPQPLLWLSLAQTPPTTHPPA